MSMFQKFEWLMQKCKEGFGDAVKTIFKNIFTSLILLIASILVFALLLVRQSLDHTFEVSVMQILIILSVFFIIVVVVHWAIYRLRQRVTLSDYCSDVIYDIVWEWETFQYQEVSDICPTPICPSCAYRLRAKDHPQYMNFTLFECNHCHWMKDLEGDYNSIKLDIIKIVEQRIRNNDWKNAQKRLKALKK